jgi:hypothetical protein
MSDTENLRFEPLPLANLAGDIDIFEKIHLQFLDASPFAAFAPSD